MNLDGADIVAAWRNPLNDKIIPTQESSFGRFLLLDVPKGYESPMVLVCMNNGFGDRPVYTSLVHQVYLNKLADLVQDNPDSTTVQIFIYDSKTRVSFPASDFRHAE